MSAGGIAAILGFAAVAGMSALGWPWNIPVVLFGGIALGMLQARAAEARGDQ